MSDTNIIEEEVTKEETKSYELRDLKATDMGAICKIVTAIGIREFRQCFDEDNIKQIINSAKKDKKDKKNVAIDPEVVGFGIIFDVAGIIISNIPKAETEIQTFLASLAGVKVTEIRELSFADYGEMIMTVVMKDDFKDFFGRVIKLFK